MPLPLSAIVMQALAALRLHGKAVAVIAAVASVILTAGQLALVQRNDAILSEGLQSMGMQPERMRELQERMEHGDDRAFQEAMEELAILDENLGTMSPGEQDAFYRRHAQRLFLQMAPALAAFLVFWCILAFLGSAAYLVMGVEGSAGGGVLARRVRAVMLPLAGVWLWALLRSFVWIPFLGPLIAVVLGPRFALAPVILLREGGTVTGAVGESYRRSGAYWGKILGNILVAGLCLVAIGRLAAPLIALLGGISLALVFLVEGFLQQIGIAFFMFFLVRLSETVLQCSPQATARKKKASST